MSGAWRTLLGVRRAMLCAAVQGCLLLSAVAPASAGQEIGSGQAFAASVAGAFDSATIDVACHGHVRNGRAGHPVDGQQLEVLSPPPPVAAGPIHTGQTGTAATEIVAVLRGDRPVVLARFSGYFQLVAIPTSLKLPCTGSGVVRFVPRPASADSSAAWVSVTFADGS
jgi:hypothetical protein